MSKKYSVMQGKIFNISDSDEIIDSDLKFTSSCENWNAVIE